MPKPLPVLDVTESASCCSHLGAGLLDETSALGIALRLKALADPVRVRLMSLILSADEQGCCTCDLAPAVGVTEATVSHHLKKLSEAGLVEGTRQGMNVWYRPRRDNLSALVRVIDPACC